VPDSNIIGMQPAYGLLDLSAGADNGKFSVTLTLINATNRLAQLSRFTETNPQVASQIYIAPAQPRTISLNFAQRF
jgi:hypothetical protein